jgi:hypothetical protein
MRRRGPWMPSLAEDISGRLDWLRAPMASYGSRLRNKDCVAPRSIAGRVLHRRLGAYLSLQRIAEPLRHPTLVQSPIEYYAVQLTFILNSTGLLPQHKICE